MAIILEELNVKQIEEQGTLQELSVRRQGVQTAVGQGMVRQVFLDVLLTDELRLEGFARELERAIQDLRKKSGLTVGDEVNLYYNTVDAELEKVLLDLVDRRKTFIASIDQSLEVEADNETQATVAGRAIWLGIVKLRV
jgi:isoleucyl-tRNA synthetase